jgi:hypothetical protein
VIKPSSKGIIGSSITWLTKCHSWLTKLTFENLLNNYPNLNSNSNRKTRDKFWIPNSNSNLKLHFMCWTWVNTLHLTLVYNIVVGYLNKGYPQLTIKKDTPLRKPRQRLRPRRRNEPKQHTERLDHVLTRTRLDRRDASTIKKSLTRTTLGRAGRSTSLTNSETKVKAFNATANHFVPPWL